MQLIVRLFRSILAENSKDLPLAANRNSTLVKGLVWIASLLDGDDLVTSMQQLSEFSFRKVPGYGPGSAKVGNAVIYSLGALPGLTAISRLTAIKSRIKYRQAQSLIEKALPAAAEERGLTIDRLEELAVPTHGLDDSGRLERRIGDHVALAEVGRGGRVSIVWRRGDGRIQKTVRRRARITSGPPGSCH